MTYRSTVRPRVPRRKAALVFAGAASAVLVFAGSANATVYSVPDEPALTQAIADSNANPGRDTIVLDETFYQPLAPYVITDDLTLTGDHSRQGNGSGPTIDGSFVDPLAADAITVNPGATLDMHGIAIQGGAIPPFAALRVNGIARVHGVTFSGNGGNAIFVGSTGNLTLTNSSLSENSSLGLNVPAGGGVATLINSNITLNNSGIAGDGTFFLRNTVVASNGPTQCFSRSTASSGSFDGSTPAQDQCGVGPDPARHGSANNGGLNLFGGPTFTQQPVAASPLVNAGDPAFCQTTDQRFFVRPVGACDIGSFERGAVRETTPPTCPDRGAIARSAGPPKTMTVILQDGESGIGQDAVRIEETTISNGVVSLVPFTSPFRSPASAPAPSNNGLDVVATKTDQTQPTQWSFIARDWAGNTRTCV